MRGGGGGAGIKGRVELFQKFIRFGIVTHPSVIEPICNILDSHNDRIILSPTHPTTICTIVVLHLSKISIITTRKDLIFNGFGSKGRLVDGMYQTCWVHQVQPWAHDCPLHNLLLNPSQPNNPLPNHPGAWPRPFSGNMRAWKSDHSARGPLSVWRSNCNQNANCSPVWREHQFRQRMIWSPIAVKRSIKEFPNIRL